MKRMIIPLSFVILSLFILPVLPAAGQEEVPEAQEQAPQSIDLSWFGQEDENWKEAPLGDSKQLTIGSHGCALTATAMVLSYYDVNTNPENLNKWLLKHEGFDKGYDDDSGEYLGYVRLIWDSIASGHDEIELFRRYDFKALPADLILIRSYLDQGIPVIAEVLRPGSIPHFVVLTGHVGDDFYIKDPLSEERTLLSEAYKISDEHGSGAGRNIYGIRIFTPR